MRTVAFLFASYFVLSTAQAAELPKQGEDSYTTDYIVTSMKMTKFGDRAVTQIEFAGISHNDNGGEMFDKLGARCVGFSENGVGHGDCVDVDKDGDQIFTTYEVPEGSGKPGTGVHQYVGGTGKYTGITGQADLTTIPVKSSDGTLMFVVPHKASWKLP